MKKRVLLFIAMCIVLALTMALASCTIGGGGDDAPNGNSDAGELVYTELPDGTYSVVVGEDLWSSEHIVIPATYNGMAVTQIGEEAFLNCEGLKSVELPSSITSIGNYAFNGCQYLTSVTIPASVISIGESAFDGCASLASIAIPAGVTSIGASTIRVLHMI